MAIKNFCSSHFIPNRKNGTAADSFLPTAVSI